MLSIIRQKIRALIEDFGISKTEPFDYTGSDIFNICGKVSSITSVSVNGVELGSGEYSFDSTTNELTITASLNSGDIILVKYNALKYTDAELDEYIRASLVWISYYSFCAEDDFELENDDIYPTPTNKEEDLIALISSILIKPDYSSYRLPTLTVNYPRTMAKEDRIEKLISLFKRGLGANDVLEWDVE